MRTFLKLGRKEWAVDQVVAVNLQMKCGESGADIGLIQLTNCTMRFEDQDLSIVRDYQDNPLDFSYGEIITPDGRRVLDLTPGDPIPQFAAEEPGPPVDFVMIDGQAKRPLKDGVFYKWSLCGTEEYHLPKAVYHALVNVQFRSYGEAMKAVREVLAKLGPNEAGVPIQPTPDACSAGKLTERDVAKIIHEALSQAGLHARVEYLVPVGAAALRAAKA